MYRFAREGIILMPSPDTYESRGDHYGSLLGRATNNIVRLMLMKEITPCMFITDEIANLINPKGVTWLQSLPDRDYKLAKKYCLNIYDRQDMVRYEELYTKSMEVVPTRKLTDIEVAVQDINKRASFIEKEILKSMKVVFNLATGSRATHRVEPSATKQRILCNVNSGTFQPTCYIADMEVNAAELLGFEDACRPVSEWRFD